MSCEISNTVVLLLGFGDGAFFPAKNVINKRGPGRLTVGDVNGDGKLDLAVSTQGPNLSSVFINSTL